MTVRSNVSPTPFDTTDEVAALRRVGWRAMSDEKKLRLVFESSSAMRKIAHAGIRLRRPNYDERQVGMAWLRLTMRPESFDRLFPGADVEP